MLKIWIIAARFFNLSVKASKQSAGFFGGELLRLLLTLKC